jgi:hypothetical protein
MLYDGELSGTEAQEAADHLRSCPACRKEYADWERIARAFFKAPQVHMSSHFVRKVMKRIETLERPAGKKHPSLLRWLVPAMGMGFIVGIFTWSYSPTSPGLHRGTAFDKRAGHLRLSMDLPGGRPKGPGLADNGFGGAMKIKWGKFIIPILVGFIAGAAVATWYLEYRETGDGKDRYSRMLEEFSKRLELTDEQKRQIGEILEEKRQKISALRAEIRPRFEEIRRAVREDIRSLLNPDQQKAFDAIQSEWEARRKKRFDKDR